LPGEFGRLEWLFDALRTDPSLPDLVVLDGLDPRPPSKDHRDENGAGEPIVPDELRDRVVVVRPRELADVGAVLAGASLLLQPQTYSGTGYTVLGALGAGVPVLHADQEATAELVLDAGVAADASGPFAAEYSRLFRDTDALAQLSVLACDRGRGFSWRSAAWQLWETHANL
jgi:glycosyltransferase involved in cell wall biosynthesis